MLNKNYNIKSEFYSANVHRVNSWDDIRRIFVEKFDLLPETSEAYENYLNSFGEPIINDSYIDPEDMIETIQEKLESDKNSLLDKLLKCKTKNDYSELLNPYFEKTFNAGYNSALGDMAKYMKELDKFQE